MVASSLPHPENEVFDIAQAEVSGHSVLASICANPGLKDIRMQQWLALGIPDCAPENWYSLPLFLKFLNDMGPKSVYLVGREIPSFAIFPSEIVNLESALASIDIAYHANHRNGRIGYYKLEYYSVQERKAIMACVNPYPKSLDWGLLVGLSRRFIDPASRAALRVIEDPERINPSETNENGSFFLIMW